MRARRVRLVAMGGTIAARPTERGALHALGGEALAASVGVAGIVVEPVDLAAGSSIAFTDATLLALLAEIEAAGAAGLDGVVVTHGTDTLEETAYFLALAHPRGLCAVVLTGAMRHDGSPGADGAANLRDALLVAADPRSAALGPVVVMDGAIHPARFATKLHPLSVGGFASLLAGPLGRVSEGRVSLWLAPAFDDHLGRPAGPTLPRVELTRMALGASPAGFAAVLATRPAGVVVDGLGGGHVPPPLLDALDGALAAGVAVVVASRAGEGPTNRDTYGAVGCERDLQERGVVMAGALGGTKARLRLAVALALGLAAGDAFPVD
ncbi:MAG: asparaginase domain-containing protein [Thermoleophilia bacterium]